jgi:hypothetical protein
LGAAANKQQYSQQRNLLLIECRAEHKFASKLMTQRGTQKWHVEKTLVVRERASAALQNSVNNNIVSSIKATAPVNCFCRLGSKRTGEDDGELSFQNTHSNDSERKGGEGEECVFRPGALKETLALAPLSLTRQLSLNASVCLSAHLQKANLSAKQQLATGALFLRPSFVCRRRRHAESAMPLFFGDTAICRRLFEQVHPRGEYTRAKESFVVSAARKIPFSALTGNSHSSCGFRLGMRF